MTGELLFLNQYTRHKILPAGEEDIAINFMILPEFFDVAYTMAGNNNVLADFLVNVLRQDEERGEYLHFKVAEVLQIQNLLENYYLFPCNRKRQPEQNQSDYHGTYFSLPYGLCTVCGNAPSKSVREHDIHDDSGLY